MFSKMYFKCLFQLRYSYVYYNYLLKNKQIFGTTLALNRFINYDPKPSDNQMVITGKITENKISLKPTRNDLKEMDINDNQLIDLIGFRQINALDTKPDYELIDEISPTLGMSFNLSAFADKSKTLQMLIKLGIDLSSIEKRSPKTAEYILKLDFEEEVKPYITFLIDNGIKAQDLGNFFTKNPVFFKQHLEDLEIRIKYLESKKFTKEMISSVITNGPLFLNIKTKIIDSKLAAIQKEFRLNADQIRQLITTYPRIALLKDIAFQELTFIFKEEFGFNQNEIREMLLKSPIIFKQMVTYKKSHRIAVKLFDLIHNQMKIPHELIAKNPSVFNCRQIQIENRHQYLEKLGRDQYDPKQPLYVPLNAFYGIKDDEFCQKYSKTSVQDFNMFLKSI